MNGEIKWGEVGDGSQNRKETTMLNNDKSIATDTWFYYISYGLMWFMIRVICIGGNVIGIGCERMTVQ